MKKNSTSFWSKNFSWKRKYWTKTFRKMKRNESERSIKNLLWNLLKDWLKDCWRILWNSCHGHIFIITWLLKLKFVTLVNFFKTSHLLKIVTLLKISHLKRCDFWKKSSETSHLKNCDFWKFNFRNQSLVIDYHQGVIDYTSTDVTFHV